MKSVLALCAQDFRRLLTNALFWVLSAMLVAIVLVVRFALPAELSSGEEGFVTCNVAGGEAYGRAMASEEDLREAVRGGDVIGLVATADGILVVHPDLSEKSLRAALLLLSDAAPVNVTVETLGGGGAAVPFNERSVPAFICFEALVTGFILGGALMLSEKEDGTARALRIAPMGAARYLSAKTLLFSGIGTLYAALICLLCVGTGIAWIPFLLLTFFGTATMTLLGLAYTTLFRDMSGWFFSMALLLSVNMLPAVSYVSPVFAPFWMKLLPSYPVLFSLDKAMFGGGYDIPYTVGSMAVWLALACLLAYPAVKMRFLGRGRGE